MMIKQLISTIERKKEKKQIIFGRWTVPVKVPIYPLSWVEISDVGKDNEIEGSREMTCLVWQITLFGKIM